MPYEGTVETTHMPTRDGSLVHHVRLKCSTDSMKSVAIECDSEKSAVKIAKLIKAHAVDVWIQV